MSSVEVPSQACPGRNFHEAPICARLGARPQIAPLCLSLGGRGGRRGGQEIFDRKLPRAGICLTLVWFRSDEFWFSDGSLSEKSKCADPGLMPLPDAGTGLDWPHLVDAARAFEGKDSPPAGWPSGDRLRPRGVWVNVWMLTHL